MPPFEVDKLSNGGEKLSSIEVVAQTNALEKEISELSLEELRQKTTEFRLLLARAALTPEKKRPAAQEKVLNKILPQAFAVVREVSEHVLGMRHYDEQLMAGLSLHQGSMAEMKTGEGKTLAATLAVYLNALVLNQTWVGEARQAWGDDPSQWQFEALNGTPVGQGVHIITSNDYLAERDAHWMSPIYESLGLTSGVLASSSKQDSNPDFLATRKAAYQADITYGTSSEFGFDFLRDSLALNLAEIVQRGHRFAIVDEADDVLADEAVTPLALSGSGEIATEQTADCYLVSQVVADLKPEHYEKNDAEWRVELTAAGEQFLSEQLKLDLVNSNLPEISDPAVVLMLGLVQQALQAEFLYKKDQHYILLPDPESEEMQVVIVNLSTGRSLFGRSWSDGLHQAIEAKEGLPISPHDRTFNSITIQSYFRMYEKLAGMTGSALGLENELTEVYGMEVDEIPPHRENQRLDEDDVIFWDEDSKLAAIKQAVEAGHQRREPILLGTASIVESQRLMELIQATGIDGVQLLNAYQHQREAEIISAAGAKGATTIATNMAGRGVDIKLGGAAATPEELESVKKLGGLQVLGSTRNRSRRSDLQLQGRAGRQGDPGQSRFYVSLQDDLMTTFAQQSSELRQFLADNQSQRGLITDPKLREKAVGLIEAAQTRISQDEAAQRKQLWEHSQVIDRHRAAFIKHQRAVMVKEGLALDEDLTAITNYELEKKIMRLLTAHRGQEVGPAQVSEFLNWLEIIQPTVEMNGEFFPSFGLDLLVKKAMATVGVDSLDSLSEIKFIEILETFLEMKRELLLVEQKKVMESVVAGLNKIDVTKLVELDNFISTVNLMIPGEQKIEIAGVIKSRPQLLSVIVPQVSRAFVDQIELELGGADMPGQLEQELVAQLDNENSTSSPALLKQHIIQAASTVFLEEGKLKSTHSWLIQDAVKNIHPTEVSTQVAAHLDQAQQFIEQNWPTDVFNENGQGLSFEDFKRQALLAAGSASWTDYLTNIEWLQQAIELQGQTGVDTLSLYSTQANTFFEDMLQKTRERTLYELFQPRHESDIPDGELTTAGSYLPAVRLARVKAAQKYFPVKEFEQHLEMLQHALRVEAEELDLTSILEEEIGEVAALSEQLLALVDKQVVVFVNEFDGQEGNGVDVAFSTKVNLPPRVRRRSGETTPLTELEKVGFTQLLQKIVNQRALQLRFRAVLRYLELSQTGSMPDHYERVAQNKSGLEGKIESLDHELAELVGKLWEYLA